LGGVDLVVRIADPDVLKGEEALEDAALLSSATGTFTCPSSALN
jgi:hypothetical protein